MAKIWRSRDELFIDMRTLHSKSLKEEEKTEIKNGKLSTDDYQWVEIPLCLAAFFPPKLIATLTQSGMLYCAYTTPVLRDSEDNLNI